MLQDAVYSIAPQAEHDQERSIHNFNKINVLDMMMSVSQTKPVLAP
jgi:hypothetical protein